MKNKRGYTAQDRIKQDIEYAKSVEETGSRTMLIHKALGAADFAVEFGLITYKEWETHIDNIFQIA